MITRHVREVLEQFEDTEADVGQLQQEYLKLARQLAQRGPPPENERPDPPDEPPVRPPPGRPPGRPPVDPPPVDGELPVRPELPDLEQPTAVEYVIRGQEIEVVATGEKIAANGDAFPAILKHLCIDTADGYNPDIGVRVGVIGDYPHALKLCGATWGGETWARNKDGVPLPLKIDVVAKKAGAAVGAIETWEDKGHIARTFLWDLDMRLPSDSLGLRTHHVNPAGTFGMFNCRYRGNPKMRGADGKFHSSGTYFGDPFDDLIFHGQREAVEDDGVTPLWIREHSLSYIKNQGNVWIINCTLEQGGRSSFQIRPHPIDPSNPNVPYGNVVLLGNKSKFKGWGDFPHDGGNLMSVWCSVGGMLWVEGNDIESGYGCLGVQWQPSSAGNYINDNGRPHNLAVIKDNPRMSNENGSRNTVTISACDRTLFLGKNNFVSNGTYAGLVLGGLTANKWGAPANGPIGFESPASRTSTNGVYTFVGGQSTQFTEDELLAMTIERALGPL